MKKIFGILATIGLLFAIGCDGAKNNAAPDCAFTCAEQSMCTTASIIHAEMVCLEADFVCCESLSPDGGGENATDTHIPLDTATDSSSAGDTDADSDSETATLEDSDSVTDTTDTALPDSDADTDVVGTDTGIDTNSGETCAEARMVRHLPYSDVGNTTSATNEYGILAGQCPGGPGDRGAASNDVVYAFTPNVSGVYTIAVDGFDAVLYVVTDCANIGSSCLAASDETQGGVEQLRLSLAAGTTYYLVVDGWGDDLAITGAYTLTVSAPCSPTCGGRQCGDDGCGLTCGACIDGYACNPEGLCALDSTPGNSCTYPIAVTATPFADDFDTTARHNLYGAPAGACAGLAEASGGGSNEVVYAFVPETTGRYTISTGTGFDTVLYVVTDCSAIGSTCMAGKDIRGSGETLRADLIQGTAYYIIADGWGEETNVAGASELSVSAVCVPTCDGRTCGDDGCSGVCGVCDFGDICNDSGNCELYSGIGDTCEKPYVVDDPLPVTLRGSTVLAGNDYAYATGDCAPTAAYYGSGLGSDDEVFAFVPPEAGYYTLVTDGDFDTTVYVVTDCVDIGSSCVDAIGRELGPNPETLALYLMDKVTYYIIVDGDNDTTNLEGDYTLSISTPCIPDCGGRECGDDGCGFTCGSCTAGDYCDNAGTCQGYDTLGDSCHNPFEIDAVPFEGAGDTTAMHNAYGMPDYACGDDVLGGGDGANDVVYVFTPETTGYYTMYSDNPTFDNMLYVVSDCTDIESTCLAGMSDDTALDPLEVFLDAAATYYVIFDGEGDDFDGPYTLYVDAPCVPDCGGKECGDDGCGHACDECGAGEFCNVADQCEVYMGIGDVCVEPFVVDAVPFTASSDTAVAGNQLSIASGDCAGVGSMGGGSNDEVYAFTPTVKGVYTITLDPEYDSSLYVVTDCGDMGSTCIGGDETNDVETLTGLMVPGTTYYIVVDGYGNSANDAGVYTLTIDEPCIPACSDKQCGPDGCGMTCGECVPGEYCDGAQLCQPYDTVGDSCFNPYDVPAAPLPYSHTGSTTALHNAYGTENGDCPDLGPKGGASNDAVYAFTPADTGYYTITTGDGFDNAVYIVTDCTDVSSSCLAGVDDGDGETLEVLLTEGTTYYIIVDGWSASNNVTGPYVLTISQPCLPRCESEGLVCGDDGCGHTCGECLPGDYCDPAGQCQPYTNLGDSCHAPIAISGAPYVDTGRSNAAMHNAYGVGTYDCDGLYFDRGDGSNDVVYSFTPAQTGYYPFTTSGSSFDHVIYATTDCAAIPTTCVGGTDDNGGQGGESLEVRMEAGTPYYVIVDGAGTGADSDTGTYTLTLGEPCLPSCDGKACGPDGCGHTCGDCPSGDYCSETDLCETPILPGDNCNLPLYINGGSLPYSDTGDTADMHNLFTYSSGACDGNEFPRGGASNDVAYSFTPWFSDTYEVYVQSADSFDMAVYVTTNCDNIDNTCLWSEDNAGTWETFDIELEGGVEYFIIVDGWSMDDNIAGTYTFVLSEA